MTNLRLSKAETIECPCRHWHVGPEMLEVIVRVGIVMKLKMKNEGHFLNKVLVSYFWFLLSAVCFQSLELDDNVVFSWCNTSSIFDFQSTGSDWFVAGLWNCWNFSCRESNWGFLLSNFLKAFLVHLILFSPHVSCHSNGREHITFVDCILLSFISAARRRWKNSPPYAHSSFIVAALFEWRFFCGCKCPHQSKYFPTP